MTISTKFRPVDVALAMCILYLFFGLRGLMEDALGSRYTLVHNLILVSMYGVFGLLAVLRGTAYKQVGLFAVLLFLLYSLASGFWGASLTVAIVSFIGLVGPVFVGLEAARRWRGDFPIKIAQAIFIYTVLTLPLFLLGLEVALHVDGSFRGLTSHKNTMGNITGFAAVVFFCVWRQQKDRAALLKFFVLALVTLLAKAFTSLLAVIVVCVIIQLALIASRRALRFGVFMVLSVTVAVIVLPFAFLAALTVLEILGRDTTLSSRTIIWPMVYDIAATHMWFGNGYGTFWVDGSPAYHAARRTFYGVTFRQAHNGYLELFAQAGLVGLGLGMIILYRSFRRTYELGRDPAYGLSLWGGLLFWIFNNFGEANMFIPNYFAFAYVVIPVLSVHVMQRISPDQRRPQGRYQFQGA